MSCESRGLLRTLAATHLELSLCACLHGLIDVRLPAESIPSTPHWTINPDRYGAIGLELTGLFPCPASYIQEESEDSPRQRVIDHGTSPLYLSLASVNDVYQTVMHDLRDR